MKKILLLLVLCLVNNFLFSQSFPATLNLKKLHKEEMLSVPFIGSPEESPAPGDYDNSIYSPQYTTTPSIKETYVINANFGAIPKGEVQIEGSAVLTPGVFMKNLGAKTLTGAKLQCVISHFPLPSGASTKMYDMLSAERLEIEPDSIRGVVNETFDFKNGKGVGRYQYVYTVSQDSVDNARTDNSYTANTYVTNNLYSKGRINPTNKQLQITQYWGGGTDYREVMFPFSFSNGNGLTIDTLFTGIASNDGVADIYCEGRIYKWTDLNSNQDIDNDEMELVALGSSTVPSSTAGNFTNLRIGLENIASSDPRYKVETGVLYFASLMYPGGGKTFFSAYDMVPSHRMLINVKEAAMNLQYEDYPYLSVRAQDGATGGPDMTAASLFYVDLDMSGEASDNEIFFFPTAMAIELGGVVATENPNKEAGINVVVNPSPAKDIATAVVKLEKPSDIKIELFNSAGVLIEGQEIKGNSTNYNKTFQVNGYSAGTYIVKVSTKEGFVKKPFFIIK
ncbi:MAG: T9SS type A sorting domain-containing protein [Saprospiraceae bacterium]|nr:T9SS type A sorting domain-containing protein [Saprospiraceae bacterium]